MRWYHGRMFEGIKGWVSVVLPSKEKIGFNGEDDCLATQTLYSKTQNASNRKKFPASQIVWVELEI